MKTLTGILFIVIAVVLFIKSKNIQSDELGCISIVGGMICLGLGLFLFINGILPLISLLN